MEKSRKEETKSKDKMENKGEKNVVKVKNKGTSKLVIRKPIARFGPLMGCNLVTINKEKGKII